MPVHGRTAVGIAGRRGPAAAEDVLLPQGSLEVGRPAAAAAAAGHMQDTAAPLLSAPLPPPPASAFDGSRGRRRRLPAAALTPAAPQQAAAAAAPGRGRAGDGALARNGSAAPMPLLLLVSQHLS